ncbi:MAG: hypothetical protein AB7U20_01035 [Planctomycetaceae bacterium]
MTMYPWLKRHKRYLSFRYLFPQVAAAWIILRRGLLRLVWFFTHPIDELLDDVREVLLWPFAVLYLLGQWIVLGVVEFLKDLSRGIEAAFGWIGRLRVWDGAALAGVMGIILTLLLFLLPAIQTAPVPASIRPESPVQTLMSGSNAADARRPAPSPAEGVFDPFAAPQGTPIVELPPSAAREVDFSFEDVRHPELHATMSRMTMPLGWDARRKMRLDSVPSGTPQRERWMALDQATMLDGWQQPRVERLTAALDFSPYAARAGARSSRLTPSWIAPEDFVDPLSRIISRREPSIVVEKIAPPSAPVGQPFQYALLVRNVGDENLESVQIRERVSAIERVTNVEPAANIVGEELVWDVVDLRPGEQRRLQVEIFPDQPLTLTHDTTIQVTTGIGAISDARHPRPEPPLAGLEPEPSPLPRERNPDPESPRMILPDFGPEPTEPAPQESARRGDEPSRELFPWSFDTAEGPPPQQEPAVDVDELPAEQPNEVSELFPAAAAPSSNPTPPPPVDVIAFAMKTPPAVLSGGSVRTIFELHNRGEEDLTNVVLAVRLSSELQHRYGRSLELRIDRLASGETYRTKLTTQAVGGGTARISSHVRCPDSAEKTAHRELRVNSTVPPAEMVSGVPLPRGCPPSPCLSRRLY